MEERILFHGANEGLERIEDELYLYFGSGCRVHHIDEAKKSTYKVVVCALEARIIGIHCIQ